MSVYCGIDEVPKGKKRGTLEECTAAGQLRYYGIKKIDAKKVAKTKAETKSTKKKQNDYVKKLKKMRIEMVRLRARHTTIKGRCDTTNGKKHPEKKAAYCKEAEELKKKHNDIFAESAKLKKKLAAIGGEFARPKTSKSKSNEKMGMITDKISFKMPKKSKSKSKSKKPKRATKSKSKSQKKSKSSKASASKKKKNTKSKSKKPKKK